MNFTSSWPLILAIILCSLYLSLILLRPDHMLVTAVKPSGTGNASACKMHVWWFKQVRLCSQKSGGELPPAVNQQVDNNWSRCDLCPFGLSLLLIFSGKRAVPAPRMTSRAKPGRKEEEKELQSWPSPLLGKVKVFHEVPTKFCLRFLVANVFGKAWVFNL